MAEQKKSDLETALDHAAVVPGEREPEIAADDVGATAMAEVQGEASEDEASDEAGGEPSRP
jgi:hypothetical protein